MLQPQSLLAEDETCSSPTALGWKAPRLPARLGWLLVAWGAGSRLEWVWETQSMGWRWGWSCRGKVSSVRLNGKDTEVQLKPW